jgi:hypothetical protein
MHPDERIYIFWDYFRNAYARDAELRPDHFLLSSETASRLAKAEVDKHVRGWEHTSDHAPVWIKFSVVFHEGEFLKHETSREDELKRRNVIEDREK